LKQSIQIDLVSGLIMYLVLVIVVAFSILNTFLMAIIERTREFGVLMAIGTRPGKLVNLMMSESMLMTVIGLALGMLAGTGITLFFTHHGIDMGGSSELMAQYGISGILYPRLSLFTLFAGPLVVFIITFLTALYPVLRIPAMRPVEALRSA
jgi:ABC-type antimicrobial peptide transport system permease subunit